MAWLDPAVVREWQRRISGLNDQLEYQENHTIYDKYTAYKAAQKAAGTASKLYKDTNVVMRAQEPYDPHNFVSGPVCGGKFYPWGHQLLAPLAGQASSAAE